MRKTVTSFGVAALAGFGLSVFCLILFNPEISKHAGESEAAIVPGPVFYLPTLLNIAPPAALTHDFETGDLTGWTRSKDDNSFEFQPTFGDNPTARNRGQPSKHQGDWWIGGYEKYQGPKAKGQVAGGIQGDAPMGDLTSIEFKIVGDKMNFLVGAGNHPWIEPKGDSSTCVNLEINGKMEMTVTGQNTETMARVEWDVSKLKGKTAVLKLYDRNAGGWGHINFDDVQQTDAAGKAIPWDSIFAVDALGKLPTTFGQIKSDR
ncbi:hypothetical protein HYR99_35070 [Candidatus Poribacteria bacterium]|nr:hypothetical protein [Candidatus Poribacteria bacterium]